MTEAAAAPPRGPNNGYFFGFGTGAFSLFLVALVWTFGGKFFAFFGEVATIFFMLIGALLAAGRGDDIPWELNSNLNYLVGATLFMAWASSWFFATAVLAWPGKRQGNATSRPIQIQSKRNGSAAMIFALYASRGNKAGRSVQSSQPFSDDRS